MLRSAFTMSPRSLFFCQFLLCFHCMLCLRPNFVVVLTDDQDFILGGITPMTKTLSLIGNEGATYVNSFVASPVCCPSRASILSGQFPHNHGTINNSLSGNCNGEEWVKRDHETYPAILSETGYDTFYAGKYLNQYGRDEAGVKYIPTGWSSWAGLVGNSVYYNFTLSMDGEAQEYNQGEYLTDVIRSRALNYLKDREQERPFLMVLAPPAPHAPFMPAARHIGTFKDITAKRTPNFNYIDNADKHWLIRMDPSPLSESTIENLDKVFRDRWETLLSVDEMISNVVEEIIRQEVMDNTFIIITSDNGYHMGQFAQYIDKRQPYETDIRVPLMIRGPGICEKSIIHHPVINVDLAPTILKLAGIDKPDFMDGTAIPLSEPVKSITENEVVVDDFGRIFPIEYHGESLPLTVSADCPWEYDATHLSYCNLDNQCKCQDSTNNTYSCVRHIDSISDFVYCSFKDSQEFEEAYDLSKDPYQMTNVVSEMLPAFKYKYRHAIEELTKCKGKDCDYKY